jgi:hypothetical protein
VDVEVLPDAEGELAALPAAEQHAMQAAFEKLEQYGDQLPFPHSSHVKDQDVRELRPRAGRSRWRAFYRRIQDRMVIAAIGPEASADSRGFRRAASRAEERLAGLTIEERKS